MAQLSIPRPFLKWVGGKGQIVDQLIQRAPTQFGAYHEPFLGGGAFFFGLYRAGRIRQAYLTDVNSELIDTFRAVRDETDAVLARLETFRHTEKFFYALRKRNPKRMIPANRAARMIFLNKTCYNGLYRVNSKGQFNAPFGRYKNPNYRDPENLYAVAQALANVSIQNQQFNIVLENTRPGDFVYFDPPYVPLSATANFTGYSKDGFGHDEQQRLRNVACELTNRGVHVMISNSATPIVRGLYEPSFNIDELQARRAINSNPDKRGKLTEFIITNY